MIKQRQYRSYTLQSFRKIPQVELLSEEQRQEIEVVGNVLPFKTNSYVVDELIDWDRVPHDPMYRLTFPQRGMLSRRDFDQVRRWLTEGAAPNTIRDGVNDIRYRLNPHPAGQLEKNVPEIDGIKLPGIQHKYRETVLFFPQQGQTCHAYCTFCFRWPQFVGMDEIKFAMRENELLVRYLQQNPEVTDIIFTGGDPMVSSAKVFARYIDALLEADLPNLKNIRIGSKSLTFWPYKFVTDKDADAFLNLFQKVNDRGRHLTFMAHFNHPVELSTDVVAEAIRRIRQTGTEIRTQAPLMRGINDHPDIWAELWRRQVQLGCVPYYMFIARDTGAQQYFAVRLERCWKIYKRALRQVSGICRTARGPSMSADPGKVQVLGVQEIRGEKVFVLNFLQARNPEWVGRPFFAKFDPDAIWLDDLEPAFDAEHFFFDKEEEEDINGEPTPLLLDELPTPEFTK